VPYSAGTRSYTPFGGVASLEDRRQQAAKEEVRRKADLVFIQAIEALANEEELPHDVYVSTSKRIQELVKFADSVGTDPNCIRTWLFAVENLLSGDYIFKDVQLAREMAMALRRYMHQRNSTYVGWID
jgi:hypothetical protein